MLKAVLSLAVLVLAAAPTQVRAQPGISAEAQEAAYAVARPLIEDMQRVVTPNGIQTLETVELGGMDQWVSIRGADRDNPILIYVHGGPGAIEMGRSWPYQRTWEDFFTVVQWDQRGTGKTLTLNGEAATRPTLSRERMAADLVELMAHLRERFGDRRMVLLGHSWGNVIGLDAAMARPDWVSAYIGVGPLLVARDNEAAAYDRLVEIARERGDDRALAELESIAPYPGDGAIAFEDLNVQRAWVQRYGGLAAYRDNANFFFRAARLSPDYDLTDIQNINAGGQLSVSVLMETWSAVDFSDLRRTPFPVLMFVGRHDLTTLPQATEAWLEALDAPSKTLVWFEHSAHLAPHEEPGRFLMALVEHVLPLARD